MCQLEREGVGTAGRVGRVGVVEKVGAVGRTRAVGTGGAMNKLPDEQGFYRL